MPFIFAQYHTEAECACLFLSSHPPPVFRPFIALPFLSIDEKREKKRQVASLNVILSSESCMVDFSKEKKTQEILSFPTLALTSLHDLGLFKGRGGGGREWG